MTTSSLESELEPSPDLVALEHQVLEFWSHHQCFDRLRERNRLGPVFRFVDGPITANNPMGVHHAWGRTLKDVFLRYKALHGFTSHWQNGFDAQGLWVEVEVEKELGFSSKRDIERYGIAEFVLRCKERVEKYAAVQTAQSIRLGQWMRWDDSYFTNTDLNIEGIWYFLKQCHENGWIHKTRMPLTWCPRCGTSLSEHEAAGSHRELTHRAVFVEAPLEDGRRVLVWTTTPWTLPANVALAVNPGAMYREIRVPGSDKVLIAGEEALPFVRAANATTGRVFPGSELVGLAYETFFPALPAQKGIDHRIVPWAEIDPTEGTGVVHIAPGCGLEDFELARAQGLPIIAPIDESGRYVGGFETLTGMPTTEATPLIVDALDKTGKLLKAEDYTHSYPVCWRCKTETVFRLSDEWFIRCDPIRSRMVAAAKGVRWEPDHVGKRMEDWLANMGDWNISRKRFYGLPLPFYPCETCGRVTIIGSRAELLALAVDPSVSLPELHRPWVDELRITCPVCSTPTSRVTEVGDVWLDAGIVPYTTLGFFDDRERWQKLFPAEWITEMREQVRLWFYSMLFMGVTLHDRAPYERVLAYESVVSEDRRKFSKTGYMIGFDDAVEQVGADAMRYLFAQAGVGSSVRFGYTLTDDVRRQLLALWNAFVFFHTYAALDRPDVGAFEPPYDRLPQSDAWLLARANQFLRGVSAAYDAYATPDVVRQFEAFVDDLSNWYIRINRKRFWRSGDSEDKQTAFWSLSSALRVAIQAMSPITPFAAEALWQKVIRRFDSSRADVVSVHHAGWPGEFPVQAVAARVLHETAVARQVVSLALRLRNEHGLKVRQPLARLAVVVGDEDARAAVERMRDVIADQINVKDVVVLEGEEQLEIARLTLDFGAAGPELKGGVKRLKDLLAGIGDEDMAVAVGQFDRGQAVALPGWPDPLPAGFFQRQRQPRPGMVVAAGDGLTVALDTEVPESLADEGLARDLVRQVQVLRKEAGFRVEERITLGIATSGEPLARAVEAHRDFIMEQTLADSLVEDVDGAEITREVDVGDHAVRLSLRRARRSENRPTATAATRS